MKVSQWKLSSIGKHIFYIFAAAMTKNSIVALSLVVGLLGALTSCDDSFDAMSGSYSSELSTSERSEAEETRRVLILYMPAYNNLSDEIRGNLEDLEEGYLPGTSRSDDVVLAFSKFPAKDGDYNTASNATLVRFYDDGDGPVRDTLVVYDDSVNLSDAGVMYDVLSYICEEFPAAGYGLLFSSHSTGWVPGDYYSYPSKYSSLSLNSIETGEDDPYADLVKSFGADYNGSSSNASFIELEELAAALPMHFDYIIFDACLDGGVEIAYELKDACDYMVGCPTEVLSQGFIYKTIVEHLFGGEEPDLQAVCEDYYDYYAAQSGTLQSATVSLVDCAYMDELASVCAGLFSVYGEALRSGSYDEDDIQAYFRTSSKHWYYDLRDMLSVVGATEDELAQLDDVLDRVVIYKAATEYFIGLEIENYSGLSMYLPCDGSTYLDTYYQSLAWNAATGLVE